MKATIKRIGRKLLSFHRGQTGAQLVEYILLIGLIALPLLAFIIWFRGDLADWFREIWENIK